MDRGIMKFPGMKKEAGAGSALSGSELPALYGDTSGNRYVAAQISRSPPGAEPYRFFHPPRWPGAPPDERGEGLAGRPPNSGPDSRELVG